jgi:hypothetical protein
MDDDEILARNLATCAAAAARHAETGNPIEFECVNRGEADLFAELMAIHFAHVPATFSWYERAAA